MRLVWGIVTMVEAWADGVQRVGVAIDDGREGDALCYTRLSGPCAIADRVLLNTTAVDLDLGTGGQHFVVARGGGCEGVALDAPSGGHIMKLRYTPLQVDVLAVESQESEHHGAMLQAVSLESMPVVCCGLHSQVPLVAAAIKQRRPAARVAYCMTDHAALPLPLSSVVRQAVDAELLDTTITCGQAFGGEFEAVNLHSGLLASRHVAGADVAIVAIGPGVTGTATPFGHGGVAQGEALNAVASLGGDPLIALRMSFADARPRHRVVSHHTLIALTTIALAPVKVPVPTLPLDLAEQVDEALSAAGIWARHERVDSPEGTERVPDLRGMSVRSMGRGFADDPAFFAAAFAAGEVAVRNICS